MGVLIKCNDANFVNNVGVADLPIISALKNLYYMGGSESASVADHSGNGYNGTITGTVTYGNGYAEFSGTGTDNVMRAQDLPQTAAGIAGIALFKKTGNRAVFSAGGSTANNGALFLSPERMVFCTDTNSNINDIRFTLADSNNYYIMAWLLSATGYNVYLFTSNGRSNLASGSVSGNNVKIYTGSTTRYQKLHVGGSTYNFSLDGSADIAAAAFYVGSVSLDDISDAASFLRVYAAHVGLTVN